MIYQLFIGRFQPFHAGHKECVRKLLETGNVCIALRDTKISKNDPYTVKARKKMIMKAFPGDRDKIKIITIPDITGVYYGRSVGYKIEKLNFNKAVENISATKIRNGEIEKD